MSDGLEGVIAAETVLSEVDGKAGRLIIRGRSLDELASRTRYEALAHLLFDGFFPDLPADLAPALGRARAEVFAEVSALVSCCWAWVSEVWSWLTFWVSVLHAVDDAPTPAQSLVF